MLIASFIVVSVVFVGTASAAMEETPFNVGGVDDSAPFAQTEPTASAEEAIGHLFDGCYSDREGNVLRRSFKQSLSKNTNSKCVQICREKGFAVASTRMNTCYCANTLPLPRLHKSEERKSAGNGGPCSAKCPGAYTRHNCRGDECCGGNNAYSVFIVDEIDALKQLLRRVMANVHANPRILLTSSEMRRAACPCNPRGAVTVTATGLSVNSKGVSGVKTLQLTREANGRETWKTLTKAPSGLGKTELLVKHMEKLLDSKEPIREKPFSRWDIMCNNLFGGNEISCHKSYRETTSFQHSWTVQAGLDISVEISKSVKASALFAEVTTGLSITTRFSFSASFTKTKSSSMSESFGITAKAAPGTKVEVRFFKSLQPVSVKWRASMFADGDVLVDFGSGVEKKVNLVRVLTYEQRRLFAFGVIHYGKRETITSLTKTVDRNGRVIRVKKQEKLA